ncbi:50S ribosomal protein L3 [Patescibacteria group bacterium]|nr:50S ribosomal protein L3 [Patescibacteria group bacterium]MBU1890331.1 50S ribosomal protein L3 [Patescibacteria group bacterium]
MKFILGKKISMSQLFLDDDKVVPVTLVQAGPCHVVQTMTEEKNGYQSVQIGYGDKKKLTKPLKGHLKDLPNLRHLREFRVADSSKYKRGDVIKTDIFEVGDIVKITGTSKGKGFQGVVKKYNFKGGPASHGHKDNLRAPGSIGATEPARVFKGTRMAGRLGGKQVSTRNMSIVKVDNEKNILWLKGAVPGARNSNIMIQTLDKVKKASHD